MISIDGSRLTIADIVLVARHGQEVELGEQGKQNLKKARQRLESILQSEGAVYGINTGFGIFADQRIPSEDSSQLSRNLILSHAVGTGQYLPEEVTRAAMLVRANTLTKGYSGVRVELVETILHMLNKRVTPLVPSQGSLGSSGDLGPLSHMALVFTTDEADKDSESGTALYGGQTYSGKQAMQLAGIPRVILGPKEGLALNNGATFSAAMAALTLWDAKTILRAADAALALSLEALLGCSAAFDARLHEARGHPGQIRSAANVRKLTAGSDLLDAAGRVQDAYSLRCAPQVHGPAREVIDYTSKIIEREINAATDNPLLFEPDEAVSGGNFHGEPVGLAADFLAIAMAEVAAISERRVFRLTDGRLNTGLPPMLVDSPDAAGLNSGLMMPQYTAASLVLENQTLSHPDSVHNLPTSGDQEDHNANAMTAARHARQVVENATHVLGIELYTGARAMDLRLRMMPEAKPGAGTAKVYQWVRDLVPFQAGDAWWGPEIERIHTNLTNGSLSKVLDPHLD